jgi:glutamyl-Q tRNA(Asp) synthetase
LGSLVAAVGSFLEARRNHGEWWVRIEDLDTPRVRPGAADAILRLLERLHLIPDGEICYQSTRNERYREALQTLQRAGRAFPCACSRSDLEVRPCRGGCQAVATPGTAVAWRLRLDPDDNLSFADAFQGPQRGPRVPLDSPVLMRKDGIAAYQLAVVVDDASQGMTDVVRGADLLESTHWQIAVYRALDFSPPRFAHLPLVVSDDGSKLSKSRSAAAVADLAASEALRQTLTCLSHPVPVSLEGAKPREILEWATAAWDPRRLQDRKICPSVAITDRPVC